MKARDAVADYLKQHAGTPVSVSDMATALGKPADTVKRAARGLATSSYYHLADPQIRLVAGIDGNYTSYQYE